uniref:ENTH domain-containing protein n=1 Tax=Ascaris lumbricoides TaxID=6252 RepID=A0A9J2P744_ASCLU
MSDLLSGLANFTKSVTDTFNTYEIRKLGDKVQGMVMNYTEAETKVREATNEDPWGPTGPQMAEIAHMTFQYDAFPEIMGMLWKRMLQENKYAWRRVYKSLTLLNYLLKNGSERVVGSARDHLFEMRALENYRYTDERGKDQGLNVRHRAKLLIELIQDEEQLRVARKKAKMEGKEKYQGFSKDEMRMAIGSGSFGNHSKSSLDDWGSNSSARRCSFDDDNRESYRDREVNSFQFPDEEGRNTRDSPELGIREKTPEPTSENDDEFGDFAQARNTLPATTKPPSFDNVVPPPIPAPNLSNAIPCAPPVAHHTNTKPVTAGADLLGLDTVFGGAPQSTTQPNVAPVVNDPFGLNDMRPVMQPSSASLFASSPTNVPASDRDASLLPPLGISTAFMGGELMGGNLRTSPNPQINAAGINRPQTARTVTPQDFAAFAPPVSNSFAAAMTDDFFAQSEPLKAVSARPLSVPSTPVGRQSKNPNAALTEQNKQAVRIPSTWSDASDKVNIDLDNLGMKKAPVKQSIPMSQMAKMSASSTPNIGQHTKCQGMVSSQSMGLVPTPPKPSSGALSDMQDLFM